MGRREEALDAARRALEVEPHADPELERDSAVFLTLKACPGRGSGPGAARGGLAGAGGARAGHRDPVRDRGRVARSGQQARGRRPRCWRRCSRSTRPIARPTSRSLKLYSSSTTGAPTPPRWIATCRTSSPTRRRSPRSGSWRRVREQKLGQKDVAFLDAAAGRCSSPRRDDALREEVERLAEETESYEELAAAYEQVADDLPRGPLAERLYLVLAKVQDQKLDDPASAEASLRKILEFDPDQRTWPSRAGGDVRAARQRPASSSSRWSRSWRRPRSIEQRKEMLRQIARVYDEKLRTPTRRRPPTCAALELEPDAQTLEELGSPPPAAAPLGRSGQLAGARARPRGDPRGAGASCRSRSAGLRARSRRRRSGGRGLRARRWSSTRRTARRSTPSSGSTPSSTARPTCSPSTSASSSSPRTTASG